MRHAFPQVLLLTCPGTGRVRVLRSRETENRLSLRLMPLRMPRRFLRPLLSKGTFASDGPGTYAHYVMPSSDATERLLSDPPTHSRTNPHAAAFHLAAVDMSHTVTWLVAPSTSETQGIAVFVATQVNMHTKVCAQPRSSGSYCCVWPAALAVRLSRRLLRHSNAAGCRERAAA
jgi:hypothetical protein